MLSSTIFACTGGELCSVKKLSWQKTEGNFLAGKQSLSNIRLGSEKKQNLQDDRRGQPGWKREEEDKKLLSLLCAVGR